MNKEKLRVNRLIFIIEIKEEQKKMLKNRFKMQEAKPLNKNKIKIILLIIA